MIKRSIQLTLENKRVIYKNFLIRLVVYAISFTASFLLGYYFLLNLLQSVKTPVYNLIDLFREIIGKVIDEGFNIVFTGTIDGVTYSQKITDLWFEIILTLKNQSLEIVIQTLVFLLTFLIKDFLLGVFDYVTGILVNEHMTSLRHGKFFVILFDNFKQSLLYGLYRYIMLLVFNVIMIFLVLLILFKTIGYLSIFSIMISIVLIFVLIAIRQSLFGQTMATMVCENINPWKAFIYNFKKFKVNSFFSNFISYLFMDLIVYVIVVVCSICTLCTSMFLLSPLISVLYTTTKFVLYYLENNKKFYINFDNIFIPKTLRTNDENLLSDVDI